MFKQEFMSNYWEKNFFNSNTYLFNLSKTFNFLCQQPRTFLVLMLFKLNNSTSSFPSLDVPPPTCILSRDCFFIANCLRRFLIKFVHIATVTQKYSRLVKSTLQRSYCCNDLIDTCSDNTDLFTFAVSSSFKSLIKSSTDTYTIFHHKCHKLVWSLLKNRTSTKIMIDASLLKKF